MFKRKIMSIHDRSLYLKYAKALSHPGDFSSSAANFFNEDAEINVVHPFNQLKGIDIYLKEFLMPLQHSFEGLYRRDDILLAGEFEGQNWISSTGYYVCLLYTSPSPRDRTRSRMPSSA